MRWTHRLLSLGTVLRYRLSVSPSCATSIRSRSYPSSARFLREDFGPESDVDFLVVFQNDDYGPWMGKLQGLEEDLRALLGREVELVPKESVVQSENWIRRNHILGTAQVIYGS